jgi:hypothetical protein
MRFPDGDLSTTSAKQPDATMESEITVRRLTWSHRDSSRSGLEREMRFEEGRVVEIQFLPD